jgi:type 1 glutamine amidotransferase
VLLLARRGERTEPAAWVRRHGLGRVFCTTLGPGHATSGETFLRLAAAAVAWTAGREMPPD